MEQDRKHWPKAGPTGDPEEDERRGKALLVKLERIIKNHKRGLTDDLFPDMGSVGPPDSKRKFAKDRKIVRYAFAFGLDDHVPKELMKKYLGPEPMPEIERQELMKKYPPRPATEKELREWAKKYQDNEIPF